MSSRMALLAKKFSLGKQVIKDLKKKKKRASSGARLDAKPTEGTKA
jgi:hypothetical protein